MAGKIFLKRRNYFIKKELQGRYIFWYFILTMCGMVVFAALLFLFSRETITISYEKHDLQLGATPLVLMQTFLTANWLALLVAGLVFSGVIMLLTHRFAGPLWRFEQELDRMAAGRLTGDVILRHNDDGIELALKLNHFKKVMRDRILAISDLAREIQEHAANCKVQDEHLAKIRYLSQALEQEIGFFHISEE